jgi:hypothetical protein
VHFLFLLPMTLAFLSPALSAGAEFGIPITARDSRGHVQTIRIGVHPRATYGFDRDLGESPVPPIPPAPVLDIRLEDPEGRKQYRFDGAWVDIRPFTSEAQVDTFFVRYQAAYDAFPVILSWDSTAFTAYERALLIGTLAQGPLNLNMKKVSILTIPNNEFTTFRIILSGPHFEEARDHE